MVNRGDIVYVLIDKKTKEVLGVFSGMYEANRVLDDLGGLGKIVVKKRLLGHHIFQ